MTIRRFTFVKTQKGFKRSLKCLLLHKLFYVYGVYFHNKSDPPLCDIPSHYYTEWHKTKCTMLFSRHNTEKGNNSTTVIKAV